jgi:hypothetical protein
MTSAAPDRGVGSGMHAPPFWAFLELVLRQDEMFQGLQSGLPEFSVVFEPGGGLPQRSRLQPAVMLAADDLPADQPRALEHPEVFGNRGQGHRKRLGQPRDRGFAAPEARQDGPPRRVGQGGEGLVEGVRRIVNHPV